MVATAAAITSIASVGTTAYQLKEAHDTSKEAEKLAKEEERKKQEAYEAEKTNLLESKLASTKAALGARGVSATTGSASALLSNIEREAEEDIKQNKEFSDLNLENIENSYSSSQSKNLLSSSNSLLNKGSSLINSW